MLLWLPIIPHAAQLAHDGVQGNEYDRQYPGAPRDWTSTWTSRDRRPVMSATVITPNMERRVLEAAYEHCITCMEA